MKKVLFLTLLAVISLYSLTEKISAQLVSDDLIVSVSPEYPGPNQDVSLSVSSYSTNINSANITWRVNGRVELQGTGQKSFSLNTGNSSLITVVVSAATSGGTFNKTINIRPSEVDLIWESEGITPPFYKGKTLFSHQNQITFTAMPHLRNSNGVELSPRSLLYTWKRNGSVLDSFSGYGKNSMTLTGSLISRPVEIEVEVRSQNATYMGRSSVVVGPIEPLVVIYKKHPLYGIELQSAVSGAIPLGDSREVTLVGIPLFYGESSLNDPSLNYKWSINGIPVATTQTAVQTFRQQEGVYGTSRISLSVENLDKILQSANHSFNLFFEQGASSGSGGSF